MNDDIIDAIEELLDAERAAIIDGRLQDLEDLLPLKTDLNRRLEKATLNGRDELPRLNAKAIHNQKLLRSGTGMELELKCLSLEPFS